MKTTHLSGRKEIMCHVRRAWPTIRKWIKHQHFPARKIDGQWESDTTLIDEWRKKQIQEK